MSICKINTTVGQHVQIRGDGIGMSAVAAEPVVHVIQGDELGFIKFGSRVDLLLPLSAKILVKLDQKVIGNCTVIAEIAA